MPHTEALATLGPLARGLAVCRDDETSSSYRYSLVLPGDTPRRAGFPAALVHHFTGRCADGVFTERCADGFETGVSFFFAAQTISSAPWRRAIAALPAEHAGEFRAFFDAGRLASGGRDESAFLGSFRQLPAHCALWLSGIHRLPRPFVLGLANCAATISSSFRRAAANAWSRANSAWPRLVRGIVNDSARLIQLALSIDPCQLRCVRRCFRGLDPVHRLTRSVA